MLPRSVSTQELVSDREIRGLGAAWALLMKPSSLALVDQLIVSGSRFATTMIVGRFCGPEGLGYYVMAFAVILAATLANEALIAKPYQVYCQRMNVKRARRYFGSTLSHVFGLAALSILVTFAVGIGMWLLDETSSWRTITFVLGLTLPGIVLWEFVRRRAFAKMDMRSAVLIDGSLSLLQISGLLILGFLGLLSVSLALLVVGGAALLVSSLVIARQRGQFVFESAWMKLDLRRNWNFGKWLFAGQMVGLVQAYAVPIMLSYSFGTVATGIVMACQTIVLLSNPLLLGIANWLGPAAANAYATQGLTSVYRLIWKSTVLISLAVLVFWAGLVVLGETLLVLAFGNEFAGYGYVVGITGSSALGFAISIGGTSGLAAIKRPRLALVGSLAGAVFTAIAFPVLAQFGEITGAAWALGLGAIVASIVHFGGFVWSVRDLGRLPAARLV